MIQFLASPQLVLDIYATVTKPSIPLLSDRSMRPSYRGLWAPDLCGVMPEFMGSVI